MKHSDFVCHECGRSGKIRVRSGSTPNGAPCYCSFDCPCDHKTAIEKIDLDVPDGYEFDEIIQPNRKYTKEIDNRFAYRALFKKNELEYYILKLPHKIGDKWVCENPKCENGYIYIQQLSETRKRLCPNCKGLKAECIDIQVTTSNEKTSSKLVITWREI